LQEVQPVKMNEEEPPPAPLPQPKKIEPPVLELPAQEDKKPFTPMRKTAPVVQEDWKAVLQKHAPDLKIANAPPKDAVAKQEAALFRQNEIDAQILLLATGKGNTLLQNLARALKKRGHTVKILDAV